MQSFTALRACTNRHVNFPGFRTGRIGVLHWLMVGMIVPCFNSAYIVGAIPASASACNGYCGLRGSLFVASIMIFTGCMLLIRPTSLTCVAHKQARTRSRISGNLSNPGVSGRSIISNTAFTVSLWPDQQNPSPPNCQSSFPCSDFTCSVQSFSRSPVQFSRS